jgi:hypothetical protein
MKTIRNLMAFVGLFVGFLALGAAGAKGQVLDTPRFTGTFTLPLEAQWGKMTLPAGDYTLKFGLLSTGHSLVEVKGRAEGGFHGLVEAGPYSQTSATKNAIVCVRNGDTLIVRSLELPAIGESIQFRLRRGTKLAAQEGNNSGYTPLAKAPMPILRVPVTTNEK